MKEKTVYRTWDEPIACMAVDLLQSAGLHARILSTMTRSVYPFTVDGLGELKIVVPEGEEDQAVEILDVRFSDKGIIEEYTDDEFGGKNNEEDT